MNATPHLGALVFLGDSPFAERLRTQVRRIAPHFRTALLIGEPGAGKTEIARELHRLSPVADGPFLCCSAEEFASGTIQEVRFGTLFLKHLGALRPAMQDNLLKRLHRLDRNVRLGSETRLVIANDLDLRGAVAAGRMRQDLYARLSTIEIKVVPLRERLADIPAMLREAQLGPDAHARLLSYNWPGNLPELRQVLAEALFRSAGASTISAAHLPEFSGPARGSLPDEPAEVRLELVVKRHVADVLEQCAGNKLRAAELLGISRSTLYRMLGSTPTVAD